MQRRPLVVLLGDSVLIDSVSVRLGEKEVPGVIHLNVPSIEVHKQLGDLKPDLVVFELDSPYTSPVYTFLREHPGILLVGLDLTCSRAIVLNSQQLDTPTLDDLCHVVQTKVSERATLKGGHGN
jgi:hypothetical protein